MSILSPYSKSPHHQSLKVTVPDDLVTCGAERRASGLVLRVLLRGLEDGAAVLFWRGLRQLRVLRHHRARLVWPIAFGEIRVRHPGRAAGTSGHGGTFRSLSCVSRETTEASSNKKVF